MASTDFMDLPKEIRSMVFTKLVSIRNNTGWRRLPHPRSVWSGGIAKVSVLTWKVPVDLFTINKQVSEEVLATFYRENKLVCVRSQDLDFTDDVSYVIPTRRVSDISDNKRHVAMNIELSLVVRDRLTSEWKPTDIGYDHCFVMSAEELPKLVRLINIKLRTYDFPESHSVHLDFETSSRFYRDKTNLAENLAEKLKGLRRFEEFRRSTALVKDGKRDIVIKNLSKDIADDLLRFSNLEILSMRQMLNEATELGIEGDMYAEEGDFLTARSNYYISFLMLKFIRDTSFDSSSQYHSEAYLLRAHETMHRVGIILSAARASEKLEGFSACSICFGDTSPFRISNPCDKTCEGWGLRYLARQSLYNTPTSSGIAKAIATYCKHYIKYGDLQEARSRLREGILYNGFDVLDFKMLRDMLAEVKSQIPISKRARRRQQSRAQKKEYRLKSESTKKRAFDSQVTTEQSVTIMGHPSIKDFFELTLAEQ